MNQLYGPCAWAPSLMYHHIAKEAANLTVTTEWFRKQMEYLRDHGYTVIGAGELVAWFDQGQGLGKKAVLLTFDDAYEDFFSEAYPILKEFGFKATVFVPTGLVNNPGYLSWDQIREMSQSGLVTFGNHTWSHNNLGGNRETVNNEIGLADTQLTEHGLNSPKLLAYPYGSAWGLAETVAGEKGYLLGFTTQPGSILCKKMRLELPRTRIGNASLAAYGF
ncbi:MAG: polysaccharide deacetylase family protein [Candidatus Beckwithbacteria bacterium]|nr:polysaccharide deacetylase family protein [Candidatus Beckwithbacteria bacterium]